MGLLPLEFTDGLTDSPYFRETLQAHERELDRTNTAIKHLIKDIKDLIFAARNLSRAQRTLSDTLNNFNFECIGTSQTDDEMVIANSFKDFARLLSTIEDERDRLLEKADEAFLEPIERFRRDQIGSAKDAKKKFDKETQKYCQNLERYLNMSIKKGENQLQEADANYSIEQWHFFKAMSEYVLKLQEVNERKKFEFVETVLSFMLGWLTFYHQGHEIATDFYSVKMELQMRLQRTRNNFNMTQEETKCLRQKMLNNKEKFKQKFQDSGSFNKMYTRQGYLFLMEKKAFSTSWTKHFCQYEKSSHRLTLIQYTQTMGKILSTEEITIKECIRRNTDSIDRRFCFDILSCIEDNKSSNNSTSGHSSGTPNGSAGYSSSSTSNGSNDNGPCTVYTFQALSEEDYKLWLDALDGRDPVVPTVAKSGKANAPANGPAKPDGGGGGGGYGDSFELDDEGFFFVRKCIKSIETKGLDHKGIYRIVGVTSKVRGLMDLFSDKRALSIAKRKSSTSNESNGSNHSSADETELFEMNLDTEEFETKTITSALKGYLRNLSEPIMTFHLHSMFISAAKLENRDLRICRIHMLVHRLPPLNFKVLKSLVEHLQKVSKLHDKNLMTASNLGVCFGPTLLRTAEESVAAILDIKFVNVIAELLIENYEKIFLTKPVVQEEISSTASTVAYMKVQPQPQQNSAKDPESLIQQRPLPHVPTSLPFVVAQYGPPPNISPQVKNVANSMFFTTQPYRYGNNLMPATPAARSISSQMSTDGTYGTHPHRQLMVPNSQAVRRSSSQDQLYSVLPGTMQRGRTAMYGAPHNQSNPVPLSHLQHFQQQRNLGYSTFPHLAQSPRKPLHLSSSTPSPSPSSTISTPGGFLNQQQQQSNIIYQAPILLKNASVMATSTGLYGQLRAPHQILQPSVSYQNLHYNAEIAAATNEMNLGGGGGHAQLAYTRPMTSIGILPLHSTLSPLNRPVDTQQLEAMKMAAGSGGNVVVSSSQLAAHQQQMGQLGGAGGRPPSNPSNLLPRQMTLSSTSSASLPSTPEHSQQPSQFAYRAVPPRQVSPDTMKQSASVTPPPSITLSSVDGSYVDGPTVRSVDHYGAMYGTHPQAGTQPQPLYGTIGHQAHSRPGLAPMPSQQQPQQQQQQPNPILSTKVRTRYVCIGGSDSELSFQPNMIITNVRSSREPGWLEGNLNGKTGLIPLNYVEFIE